ncbi:MAG: tetratricopeptide repeat protein [Rhodothermaceae bacterium]|nr:tetratricopeptide repeat protein [Rhodothermaceae bacterium]
MTALTPEQWARVTELFDDALEQPPEARAAWLDTACTDADGRPDAALRAEIDALLRADAAAEADSSFESATDRFEGVLPPDVSALASESPMGRRVGPYRIVRELGRGGMGMVYLGERADGQFEHTVALKLIRHGVDSAEARRRFRAERQILASLQHPHIAHLLDGGVTEDGTPWFALEYVEGEPITAYCDRRQLTVAERLDLFLTVGEVVAYAHHNLIVHRDLKPSNILVTPDGTVKLLDFGIAKLIETDAAEDEALTHTGIQALTPEYAAPEQVRGEAITTATDVYALGLVLYELLTGHRPYRFTRTTPAEIERVVCEQMPAKPSTVVTRPTLPTAPQAVAVTPETVSRARSTIPERLRRYLGGDLDTIVLKALRKAPDQRYASAEALVEDVRRHQLGVPVLARKETSLYRASKFVRRHRAGVIAATLLIVALMGGLVVTSVLAREARLQAARADEVKTFLMGLFAVSDPDQARGDSVTARTLLDAAAAQIDTELTTDPLLQAELMGVLGTIYGKLALFAQADTLLSEALARQRQRRGANHPATAKARVALAEVRYQQGAFVEAETLLRDALRVQQRGVAPDRPEASGTLSLLGQTLRRLSRFNEADSLLTAAIATQREAPAATRPQLAVSLDRLASLRRDQGRYDEAEPLAREALVLREELLGSDHREVYESKNNLAIILRYLGDYDAAEALYREVLRFNRRRLGNEHLETATVLANLADIMMRQRRYAEAERMAREVLAIDLKLLPPEHPYIAMAQARLALTLKEREAFDEAEQLARQALAGYRNALGDEHPEVGSAHYWLGLVLYDRGRYDEAIRHFEQTLAIQEVALGEAHLFLADPLLGIGRARMAQGRPDAAEPLLRRAVALRAAAIGPSDPRTASARLRLGQCLTAAGHLDEARAALTQSLTDLHAANGADDPLTQEAEATLAALNGSS